MSLEKQLLLHLETVMKPFQNNLELRKMLFTSGKYSRKLPIFRGVEVPAHSARGQAVLAEMQKKDRARGDKTRNISDLGGLSVHPKSVIKASQRFDFKK